MYVRYKAQISPWEPQATFNHQQQDWRGLPQQYWGFPKIWGYPNSWMVYKGKSHRLEIDENWGYPKPTQPSSELGVATSWPGLALIKVVVIQCPKDQFFEVVDIPLSRISTILLVVDFYHLPYETLFLLWLWLQRLITSCMWGLVWRVWGKCHHVADSNCYVEMSPIFGHTHLHSRHDPGSRADSAQTGQHLR